MELLMNDLKFTSAGDYMSDTIAEEPSMNRNEMINELRKRDCRVIFKKANGEERDMVCTLREDVIPTSSSDNNTEPKTDGYSNAAIRVIDVSKNEWRSFRVDSVISFS
jgi:hypothetical protein